jgi:TetR/AcrR family transcriptional regulator
VLKRRQHVVEMVLSYLTQASPAEAAGADLTMIKPEIGT